MNLSILGLTEEYAEKIRADLSELIAGRVTQEHRERYIVSTGGKEYEAEVTGNLRFTAVSRADFPAVGDWVAMMVYDDLGIIHKVLPRSTLLERKMPGRAGEKQVIAANVDYAFIIQSLDGNFNINRIERYLTICNSAGIKPIIVLSKSDLATPGELRRAGQQLARRDKSVAYLSMSNLTPGGTDDITRLIEKGKTYIVLGSSGVGKSTLINKLLRRDLLRTGEISASTGKGKHITSGRELFVLDNGGIIIDTPGMRELGVTDESSGVIATFHDIETLAANCKYPDCGHRNEDGCAVIRAIEAGEIDMPSLENYRRILRDQERMQISIADRRKKERDFGKMAKEIMKEKKKNKF